MANPQCGPSGVSMQVDEPKPDAPVNDNNNNNNSVISKNKKRSRKQPSPNHFKLKFKKQGSLKISIDLSRLPCLRMSNGVVRILQSAEMNVVKNNASSSGGADRVEELSRRLEGAHLREHYMF